ncbi:putative uncharacterized protein [Coprococcus sp. CAG:782]|nr:putative uncharacterized protein [Coprococcus sp. CAG:782]
MSSSQLKNIITKNSSQVDSSHPPIARSEDGSIVSVVYAELPDEQVLVMEFELDPDDKVQAEKVAAFLKAEKERNSAATAEPEPDNEPTDISDAPVHVPISEKRHKTSGTDTQPQAGKDDHRHEKASHQAVINDQHTQKNSHQAVINDQQRKKVNHTKYGHQNKGNVNNQHAQIHHAGSHDTKKQPTVMPKLLAWIVAIIICSLLGLFIYWRLKSFTNDVQTGTLPPSDSSDVDNNVPDSLPAISDLVDNVLSDGGSSYYMPDIKPLCVSSTDPSNYVSYTDVNVDGVTLDSVSDYKPKAEISFNKGSNYTNIDGIVTFRGNNYRNDPTYGYANMSSFKLEREWSVTTGGLTSGDSTWTGSGWTGQPLIMKWPSSVRQHMNMYDWAKEKDDLVEVIYACMDGNIYFIDLETGELTRDTMSLEYTFKGSGALDPRGYPILYVGAGYNSNKGVARVFVVNLLDCSVMYEFGNSDSFSLRGSLSFFDSSALVDAATDTLIYPGENGILYLINLGTKYDEEKGTLSINPNNIVKWRYLTKRSSTQYWLGMEDSCVVYKGYLYIMDNGGHFFCLDLNTLELVWVQDSLDDSNSTPVLSVEGDKVYLYASTSFHQGWRSSSTAPVPIWKVDAETGEIIWQTEYTCYSQEGVSGGVQSTIAVGRESLSDYIYVTVSKTGGPYDGVLACLSKKDGKVMWEHVAAYAWSSPVCVYNSDGTGRVLYASSGGKLYILDGLTGETNDTIELSTGCIEASPAVYNSTLVIGTRSCTIQGIKLK